MPATRAGTWTGTSHSQLCVSPTDGERRRRQSAQVVSQESRGLKRKEPDAPLGEPVAPDWSVATDQVAFSASQTLRGLEQVVLRERAEDGGWSTPQLCPTLAEHYARSDVA